MSESKPSAATFPYLLDRVFRLERPRILDLGALAGSSVVRLAERGARVRVEEWVPPLDGSPDADPTDPDSLPPPFALDYADDSFDLVLVWEHLDFIAGSRLPEVGAELRRIVAPGGWLFVLAHMRPDSPDHGPARYRLHDDDGLIVDGRTAAPAARQVHANRDLERALVGFSIDKLHLQRSQIREMVAHRVQASK